jgi:hypothetical protein
MPLLDHDHLADLRPAHLTGQLPATPIALDLEGTDVVHDSDQDSRRT